MKSFSRLLLIISQLFFSVLKACCVFVSKHIGIERWGRMKNKIKGLRKQMGLRQEDMAERLGVTRQTIIAIENDKYDPTLSFAFKLAYLLETTVDELFEPDIEKQQ